MPTHDPIQEAAKVYEGWERLSWQVGELIPTVKSLEAAVKRLADDEVFALKMKVALLERDIASVKEISAKELADMKAVAESKGTDNRWWVGLIGAIIAIVISIIGAASKGK